MSPWSTETEALEKTPLLDTERSSRRGKNCYTLKGVRQHSPNSSMNSQLESGPSCSQSPIFRRSFSAEPLLSSSTDKESSERTSSDSPKLQCIYSQKSQPLLSKSGPFCNMPKWVELRLENSGSVARDHLASERTFLAYMRTSLAIASSGVGESPLFKYQTILRADYSILFFYVALVQFFSTASESARSWHHVYIRPLGASTVIVGLLVLFIGLFVIKSTRETTLISFIYFLFLLRSHEIFYYTGRIDKRCLSCGTIDNRVRCYDVGSPCDLDFWDPACWKVGAKMKSVNTDPFY